MSKIGCPLLSPRARPSRQLSCITDFPNERGKFGIVPEHSRKICFGREHFEEGFSSRARMRQKYRKRKIGFVRCARAARRHACEERATDARHRAAPGGTERVTEGGARAAPGGHRGSPGGHRAGAPAGGTGGAPSHRAGASGDVAPREGGSSSESTTSSLEGWRGMERWAASRWRQCLADADRVHGCAL
jgi:hypothetical protein